MRPAPKAIRAIVVGFGRMGRLHARTLQALPDFHLVAVVDPDSECATAAVVMGLRCYASLDALDERVDVAVVAVPSTQHAGVVKALAKRGIHCLVEKPVGIDVAEVDAMAAAAEEAGILIFAGFSERFNPVLREIHAEAENPPVAITVRRFSSHGLHRSFDTDVSLDLLSHDFDWVSCLLGMEPDQVQAKESRRHQGRVEELHCRIGYPAGIHVDLSASRIAAQAERSVTLQDRAGVNRVFCLDAGRADAGDDALTMQARALAGALRGESTGIADLDDARRVHRLLAWLAAGLAVTDREEQVACDA